MSSRGDHLGDLVAKYLLLIAYSFFLKCNCVGKQVWELDLRLGKQAGTGAAAVFNVLGDYICTM